jgi:hypothetical protein
VADSFTVPVRIEGFHLPAQEMVDAGGNEIHIGIQRREAVEQNVPLSSEIVTFDCDLTANGDDFRGPYVHGKLGDRFIYLSWGRVTDGELRMFSRLKLKLAGFELGPGARLDARVDLSDSKGQPRCGTAKPDAIEWVVMPDAR